MNTEENIGNIVVRLSDLKLELSIWRSQTQPQLRDYVINKQFPLEDRFEVWVEWCDKEDHRWIVNNNDVPLFGQLVEDRKFGEYFRHEVYSWKHFIEVFGDLNLQEEYGVTIEDVMECLIKTNFGSFRMDW